MAKKTKKARARSPSKLAHETEAKWTELGLMVAEVQKMTQKVQQMELALRELTAKLTPRSEPGPFALLTEPAPVPASSVGLMQEDSTK